MSFHILGNFAEQPRCHHPQNYFQERDCWVDARGKDCLIISGDCHIGWCVIFVTQTHNPRPGYFGNVQDRPIIVHPKAFIAGHSLLYNCEIGEGAIVAAGAVVRSQIVPPWTMVEGNPARIVKVYEPALDKWVYHQQELERVRRPLVGPSHW